MILTLEHLDGIFLLDFQISMRMVMKVSRRIFTMQMSIKKVEHLKTGILMEMVF